MTKYTKQQALSIIVDCALKYEQNLSGRNLLFLLKSKELSVSSLEVAFYPYNFLHLTGVRLNKKISAADFYQKCLNHKLCTEDFSFVQDGTTHLKLNVLPLLMTKNISAKMAGDFQNSSPFLYTDKLIGNVKSCLGFVKTRHACYVPNTVLNLDIRNATQRTLQVIATYRKRQEESLYNDLVYKSKTVQCESIHLPEKYSYLSGL